MEEWKVVLADPLFHSIQYLLLCGGEPTMKNDLPSIVRYSLDNMPHLRKLLIATNGLVPKKAQQLIPPIVDLCNERGIEITITLSLDGIGDVHDHIRGIPGHFQKTLEAIGYYKEVQRDRPFRLKVGTTISRFNVDDLENIVAFCKLEELSVDFYMGWASRTYYKNLEAIDCIAIPLWKRHRLICFLEHLVAESPMLDSNSYYYTKLLQMLNGNRRSFPCPFSDQGIIFDAQGDIYYCTNSNRIGNSQGCKTLTKTYYDPKYLAYRREITKNVCPTCVNSCLTGVAAQKLAFPFALHLLERGLHKAGHKCRH